MKFHWPLQMPGVQSWGKFDEIGPTIKDGTCAIQVEVISGHRQPPLMTFFKALCYFYDMLCRLLLFVLHNSKSSQFSTFYDAVSKKSFLQKVVYKHSSWRTRSWIIQLRSGLGPKRYRYFQHVFWNIARGTTDPEIDSVIWIKFSNNMAPLAFVANLSTIWRHLQ